MGSAAAIYIAEALHLEYAVSAGTVTLLSLLGTRWETIKFSFVRVGTFLFTTLMALFFIPMMHSEWVAYGLVIFVVVFLSALLGWKSTLSVNGVIAAHYMMKRDFGIGFLYNEFMLVLIGVIIALLLNLFHLNRNRKKDIMSDMRYTEKTLQDILRELANYLLEKEMKPMSSSVWEVICILEQKLREFMEEAREYQANTFMPHHDYYLDYFEMRLEQCRMLNSLHYEMKKSEPCPDRQEWWRIICVIWRTGFRRKICPRTSWRI